MKKYILALLGASLLSGCATVPLATQEADQQAKQFVAPKDKAALYIYRNSFFGGAVKKTLVVDKKPIGETGAYVYFYKQLKPGEHQLATESVLTYNHYKVNMQAGKIYCFHQYLWPSLLWAGSSLSQVSLETCKKAISSLQLGKSFE